MKKKLKGNKHYSHRVGWLRAAVLGANDGIVSTASLIIGVAAAGTSELEILLAGFAGLVAGAMSMAAGEYVSVSSQADSENADLELERYHLRRDIDFERRELAQIYEKRGLEKSLATQVATQLMEFDALEAHARDELGIHRRNRARPLQAAFASAMAFVAGAVLPLLGAWLAPLPLLIAITGCCAIVFLALLGVVSAVLGGAPVVPSVLRVSFWGAVAMVISALAGTLFDIAVL